MKTEREKKLEVALLKEKIERISGKKVVFKEGVSKKDMLNLDPEQVAKEIRKTLGISQEELAKLAGVSASTVKRGEKDFKGRKEDSSKKIITALYKKAGYEMPKDLGDKD
jgi:DNA-binding XRE family transcriptional regulator